MNQEKVIHDEVASREFGHPMRVFPWFRQLPNTNTVGFFLTAVFCLVNALVFALLVPPPRSFPEFLAHLKVSAVYAVSIGYSIHLMSRVFVPTIRIRLRNKNFISRLVADLAVWTGGAMMGYAIAATIMANGIKPDTFTIYAVIGGTILMSVVTGVTLRQQALQEIRAERDKAERSETQRTLAVSRLRLLQAQIEPHFLFNTLANVSSLIESDPKQARTMLDQFTLLLRASLDQTRKETTSLAAELQVVEAYLSVLKVRMGDRLSYKVDAPADLLRAEVPTMLLQPIVENAVKHGIEPRVKGGTVLVQVKRENNGLIFLVSDDGVGFVPGKTENIGLGAVRERLAVQFGANASIDISRTPDNWTCIAIRIPISA